MQSKTSLRASKPTFCGTLTRRMKCLIAWASKTYAFCTLGYARQNSVNVVYKLKEIILFNALITTLTTIAHRLVTVSKKEAFYKTLIHFFHEIFLIILMIYELKLLVII